MASVPRVAALGVSRALRVLSRSQLTATRPLVAPRRTYLTSNKCINQISANVPSFLACTRSYGAAAAITESDLKDRVLNVLKLFDKVNPEMVTLEAHFMTDLGLDSLDAVEVVMSFEDEFGCEISDEEAEKILTCNDAVELLKKKLDIA